MIIVTGASGNVGGELVKLCEQLALPCFAGGRRNLWQGSATTEFRPLDLSDSTTFDSIKGASELFLVRPPQISNVKRDLFPFLGRCKELGIKKVVFLSLIGVDKLPFTPHYKIEREIERLGFEHTFVRAGFFMQNLSTTHAREIRDRNQLVAPCAKGKTTFIHARDIAEVGLNALLGTITAPTVNVGGNETFTYYQVAQKLGALLERPITYRAASIPGFLLYQLRQGTPLNFALVMTGIYVPTRFGAAEYHGQDIAKLLGHEPVSFEQFLREERGVWMVDK